MRSVGLKLFGAAVDEYLGSGHEATGIGRQEHHHD
jgi:hypothetical protein